MNKERVIALVVFILLIFVFATSEEDDTGRSYDGGVPYCTMC